MAGERGMRFSIAIFAAPHRVLFFAGTFQALLAMAFWMFELGGRGGLWRHVSWPLFSLLPPAWWHAVVMVAGVLGFFIFGFILTAGPRWQGHGDLPPRHYLPAVALLASGGLCLWFALCWPIILGAGLVLLAVGFGAVALILTVLACHPAAERRYIVLAAVAVWAGATGLMAVLGFVLGAGAEVARAGIGLLLWGFLLPMFLTITHRMLPFFSSSVLPGYAVYRPLWALHVLLIASLAHGLLELFELGTWRWLVDLPAAVVALHLSWRWWDARVTGQRMLLVLHIAFAWAGLAFLLFSGQSLWWTTQPGLFGLAPVHALVLGYFSAMLVGMASRVVLGHSGQRVAPDDAMWRAFWLMQAAALLRVGSDLLALPVMLWAASLLWLAAFALWAVRYAPILWRPRSDGRPG